MNIIFDNHVHLSPSGRNIEAAKDFEKAGGTHLMLVTLPREGRSTPDDQYGTTLSIADRIRKDTTLKVYVTIGPHPVEFTKLCKKMEINLAKEEMKQSIDVAINLIQEGHATALGEVGRPHFPVSPEILLGADELLIYALERAKDCGCAVVLHTESITQNPNIWTEMAQMADRVDFPREKLVKHYSPPFITLEENHGLFPSVLAGKESTQEAIAKGTRFMLETDFLDDPRRPGAVLNITTVPKRTHEMSESGVVSENALDKIHRENPEKVYGIDMSN